MGLGTFSLPLRVGRPVTKTLVVGEGARSLRVVHKSPSGTDVMSRFLETTNPREVR